MPRKFGFQLLVHDADRQQSLLAEIKAILEALGGSPPEEPEPPEEPHPSGHVETRLNDDGTIWTPFGSPSLSVSEAIKEAWPRDIWTDAARVSYLESAHWNPHAERNTLDQAGGKCNVPIGSIGGVRIVSEDSVGLFQINVCAWPYSREQMLDAKQNAEAGYKVYRQQGWGAWLITSRTLGLVS